VGGDMENQTRKLEMFKAALIKRYPCLKEEFDADPGSLESLVDELPLEIHYRRPSSDTLTHEEEEKVRNDFYPQVHLLFEYLKPLWKQWGKPTSYASDLYKAALIHIKNYPALFPDIEDHYLAYNDLFTWPDYQQPRYFCGKLLHILVKYRLSKNIKASNLLVIIKKDKLDKLS
jgi:hypothetical protein